VLLLLLVLVCFLVQEVHHLEHDSYDPTDCARSDGDDSTNAFSSEVRYSYAPDDPTEGDGNKPEDRPLGSIAIHLSSRQLRWGRGSSGSGRTIRDGPRAT